MTIEPFDEYAFQKVDNALKTLIEGYERLVGLEDIIDQEDLPRFREECIQQDKIAIVVLNLLKQPGLLDSFQDSIRRLPHHIDDDLMLVRVEHLRKWRDNIITYAALFFPVLPKDVSTSAIQIVEQVCASTRVAASCLKERRKVKGYEQRNYEVDNEFDVQDLLYALLKSYFPMADIECPVSKIAQTASSRADIQIPEHGIIIEAKFVRQGDDQKKLLEQLILDCDYYSGWPDLKLLIFLIYDTNKLTNILGIKNHLTGARTTGDKSFEVKVLIV